MNVRSTSQLLYHKHDSRVDICNLYKTDIEDKWLIEKQSRSVACLVNSKNLQKRSDKKYQLLDSINTLSKSFEQCQPYQVPLVDEDPFRDHLVVSFATAVLITKDTILTVAHAVCDLKTGKVDDFKVRNTIVLFQFVMLVNGVFQRVFDEDLVYTIKKVKAYKFEKEYAKTADNSQKVVKSKDWAWVQLDREVQCKAEPLVLDFSPIRDNDELYMLGYPDGTAQKLASYALVKRNNNEDFFEASLDAFKGNSGSPVFSKRSKKVVGLLVGGNEDYEYVLNYKVNGVTRLRANLIENFRFLPQFEICQRIEKIEFEIQVAEKGKLERNRKSLEVSTVFEKEIKSKINKNNKNVSIKDRLCFFFKLGINITVNTAMKIHNLIIHLLDLFSKKEDLNYREAYEILLRLGIIIPTAYSFDINDSFVKDSLDFRAIDKRMIEIVRNVIAYDINFERASKLFHYENQFGNRFSPAIVLQLLLYTEKYEVVFTYKAGKRILKIMHRELGISVTEARIKACIKTMKKEVKYRTYSIHKIEIISRYMVKKSPYLTFEAARIELGIEI